jgi:2-polyprenyl-3-methyl-5-hydroxy-6-metoxy-1,4-benzoquinol methylase
MLIKELTDDLQCKCTGYDHSEIAIKKVEEKGLIGEVVDFRTFSPNGQRFSTAISSHVLEHMRDDREFVHKCADLLEDGGKLIVTVPASLSTNQCQEHQRQYSAESLKKVMNESFKEVKIEQVGNGLAGVGTK